MSTCFRCFSRLSFFFIFPFFFLICEAMPNSANSDSTLSSASTFSGRYELTCSPFTNGKQNTALEKGSAAGFDDDNDIYGASEYSAKLHSPASLAESKPPMLKRVLHDSSPRRVVLPLVGCSSLQTNRRPTANGSSSGTGETNAPSVVLVAEDNKSTASACSRLSEVDGKSERHRRYSQALQTPLTDTSGAAPAARTLWQRTNRSGTSPVTETQSARVGGNGRGSSRFVTPATTNIVASARRPNGGRLEPLSPCDASCTDASSASDDAATVANTAAAPQPHQGRTRTPVDTRRAPLQQTGQVTSAPTYLPGGSSTGSRSGGVVARSPFLREPLRCSGLAEDSHSRRDTENSHASRGAAASAKTAAPREGFSGFDSVLLHLGVAVPPTERRPSHPVITPLLDKGSRSDGRGATLASLFTPAMPQNSRSNASRSGSSSGVFSVHALVSRNKNVDNFDFGLSALGFPVEGAKPQQQQVQHQHAHPGSITPGSPITNHSGEGSFLVTANDLEGLNRDSNGSLYSTTPAPNGAIASAVAAHPALPSLQLQNKHAGLPAHSSDGSAITVSGDGDGEATGVAAPSAFSPSTAALAGDSAVVSNAKLNRRKESTAGAARPLEGDDDAAAAAPCSSASKPLLPRPPPLVLPDATQQTSPDYAPKLHMGESPSLGSLAETRAGLGMGYNEAAIPASCTSNVGTLPCSSNGSSGALASVSHRSVVLQPRCLPHNLDDVDDDLRGESSDDFLASSKCDGDSGGVNDCNRSSSIGAPGSRSSHAQPSPGVKTPNKQSPKLLGRRRGPLDCVLDKMARELDRDALLAATQPRHSDDDDDSLLYGDSDDSCSEDNEFDDGAEREQQRRSSGSSDTSASTKSSITQALVLPVRCGSQSTESFGTSPKRQKKNASARSSSGGRRRNANQARDDSAAETTVDGVASGAASAENHQLVNCRRETFLPFDEVAGVGSRGFSSLLFTSFLRHAGSSETVWSPRVATSNSSSPSSSVAATVAGLPYGNLCGSITASQTSARSMGGIGKVDDSSSTHGTTVAEETPLPNMAGVEQRDGIVTQQSGSASSSSSLLRDTQRGPAVPGPAGSLRVPAPPPASSPCATGGAPHERTPVLSNSGTVAAERVPAELACAGVLRWAKPLSPAQVAVDGEAGGGVTPGERLLRELELSNHGAWQDVRGLSILEHRHSAPTAATRVFAVDNGYTIRVLQNDLMGDCETDECVERCTADVPASATTSAAAPLSTQQALPSVLLDNAIRCFFEKGENAVALVMDTAGDFARAHVAPAQPAGHGDCLREAQRSATSCNSVEGEVSAETTASVAYAMCRKVVEAFRAFKEAQSKVQPSLVADLKVAVALIPVLPTASAASTGANTSAVDNNPLPTPAASPVKPVFYDAVSRASSQRDSCRPLVVATSPIFGTCLNECQWLVVEDESDINAAFAFLSDLYSMQQGQQGFLYIQFLHQCFVPGVSQASVSSGWSSEAAAPRGVAGFARRCSEVTAGGAAAAAQSASVLRSSRLSDIVVSSFTIAFTRFPQVFEVILDQRANTPWPLLRYALGKGPSTVLGVARVHEEDEEAAYPLSLLQRMRAVRHPRPRRGSVRTFVTEQRNKATDLKRRLADVEDRLTRTHATATARVTMKRLSVLISKLECSRKDAEEFLLDPESAHVPVYVDARRPSARLSSSHGNGSSDSVTGSYVDRPVPVQHQQQQQQLLVPTSPVRSPLVSCSEPVLLAMVQYYDPSSDTIAAPASTEEQRGTAWWTLSESDHAATDDKRRGSPQERQQQLPQPRTLTAWLTLSKSVSVEVDEVTSLNILNESASRLPVCATWRRVGEHFFAGCNVTAVVVQEKQEASQLWSLRVALELVHGVLHDTWSRPSSAGPGLEAAASPLLCSTPPSHEVARVAVSVYHVSGTVVADLLRGFNTSRGATGKAAAGSVVFTLATPAVRPLCGAAPPLSVTSQVVESLAQLEAVLREAVERLRSAQSAIQRDGTSSEGSAADLLARRCLTGPGYTVITVELTQHVVQDGGIDDSSSGEGDVYVSSLSVVNLGGHIHLLREATEASSAMENEAAVAGGSEASASSATPAAVELLSRLLVRRRDLVVCAAALPPVPTAATAFGFLNALKAFQQNAACVPHLHDAAPPCSVRDLIARLQTVIARAEGHRATDAPRDGGSASQLTNVRDALRRAQAVLANPRTAALVSYPYSSADAEAMAELPTASQLAVDTSVLRMSTFMQHNASSTVTTAGTISTVGNSGSSPEMSTVPDGPVEEKSSAMRRLGSPSSLVLQSSAAAHAAAPTAKTTPSGTDRETSVGNVKPKNPSRKGGASPRDVAADYYGVHYSEHDTVLTHDDVARVVAHRKATFACVASETEKPSLAASRAGGGSATAGAGRATGAATTPTTEGEDDDSKRQAEAVLMPSVLVLNAATTGAYVRRHGTRVRIPLPASTGVAYASCSVNEVVNVKPTSTGMKSSLLVRAVLCVSHGRTAALLIADTESCDAASCIAWLTLRTVMGGIFQSLKMKEVEGVQHCATLRAFLIEENCVNEFADLLAPHLTTAKPRHVLTRLKHSPFCGPVPADATVRPVKDLQDVNVALSSVLAAARLAHQAASPTATTTEPLRGAIALQLTFHQFVPAAAGQPADVVVSSLWCVQMGCSAGWMEARHTAPGSATASLLQYWMGGPCYTTSVVGLSRFSGVRVSTWKELIGVQRRLREVPLRLPRLGSVRTYMAVLQRCLMRADPDVACGTTTTTSVEGGVNAAVEKPSAADAASTGSSSTSTSRRVDWMSSKGEGAEQTSADAVRRVAALLKEAKRLVECRWEGGETAQLPSQLAHEAKVFAALES